MFIASVAFVAGHGCATHVMLPSPPVGGAASQAIGDYCDAMRPVARVTRAGPAIAHVRGGRHRFAQYGLELQDGTFVTEPEDLIAVVGHDSDAGMSARDAADAQLVADLVNASTLATFLTGASLLTLQTMPDEQTGLSSDAREGIRNAGFVSLGLTAVSLGVLVLASERATDARMHAFARYEAHFDENRCMVATRRAPSSARGDPEAARALTMTTSLE